MHVLMIEFWGASNRYSLNLARSLCNLNIEITLISVEDCIKENSIPYRLINIFPSFRKKSSLFIKFLKYLRAYLFVIWFAKKSKSSIVHFQYFRIICLDWIFVIILKFIGLKIAYTAHNILPHERRKYHKVLFKLIYRFCDLIIVTSRFSRNQIESKFGIKPSKVMTIPIGNTGPPELTTFSKEAARNLLQIPSNVNLMLSFGQIREYKGIDTLIKAVAYAKNQVKNLKLIIAGTSWDKKLLESYSSLIRELGIQHVVEMHSEFIKDKDVPLYITASDVLVLPYKRTSGHSAVLFLGYYFARPAIATRVGGLGEAVEEGKSGFLTPPNDEVQLAKAIVKAFGNPKELIKMGKYAKIMNQNIYSWDRIGKATLQAYRRIANGRFLVH